MPNYPWHIFFQNWIITTGYCGQLNDELDHNNFIVIAGEFNLNSVDGNEQVNSYKYSTFT